MKKENNIFKRFTYETYYICFFIVIMSYSLMSLLIILLKLDFMQKIILMIGMVIFLIFYIVSYKLFMISLKNGR